MSNEYKALLRHPELLGPDTCVLGAGDDLPGDWITEVRKSSTQILSWDWLTCEAYRQHNIDPAFGMPEEEQLNGKLVILIWPKSKVLAQSLLERLRGVAKRVIVVGANDAGGKSIGKAASASCTSAEKFDSARHCSLWELTLRPADNEFNWIRQASSFQCDERAFMTLPGVFSHGQLDRATAILLEHIPAPSNGKLLDLACGSGVIGLTYKLRNPALNITLSDTDAFALRSAQLNSVRLQAAAEIVASDGLKNIDGKYDYIFTNPPFHQGKDTDYRFAQELFRMAKAHLVRDGQLWLVANRHLPYEEWARESFSQVEVMTQEQGFKLICVQP